MAIYLKNATFIDPDDFSFRDSHIRVTEGVGGTSEFVDSFEAREADRVIDCRDKLVTKAFACGHHHVYSALARGMGPPKKTPENFYEILKYIWWTLDKSLDPEMIEASALVTAISAAKSGVTMVIDHHASPFAVEGSLETLARAFDRVGVSHLLCYELSDRDGERSAQQGLAETESYLRSGRQGLVGLHASFTVGDELLGSAVQLARSLDSGIHVHVAEDPVDQQDCLEKHGKRVIQRFFDAGMLESGKTILAHVLYLDDEEKALIREAPCWVVGNMESNLNNNVGTFSGAGLGERVMLGTDGMHSDMLRSAQVSYLAGQAVETPAMDTVYRRLRNVHRYLASNGFSGDGGNNLVILDYDSPTETNQQNFLGHFFFGLTSRHVETVISDGRIIVENGSITTVNESEILAFSKAQATRLWQKMQA